MAKIGQTIHDRLADEGFDTVRPTGPDDEDMITDNRFVIYLEVATGDLKVKIKDDSGTIKTATLVDFSEI